MNFENCCTGKLSKNVTFPKNSKNNQNFPEFSKIFFPLSRQTNDKFGNFSVFQIFKAFSSYFLTLVFFSLYFSSKSSKFWFKMLICKEKSRKINGLGSLFSKWTGLKFVEFLKKFSKNKVFQHFVNIFFCFPNFFKFFAQKGKNLKKKSLVHLLISSKLFLLSFLLLVKRTIFFGNFLIRWSLDNLKNWKIVQRKNWFPSL